MSTVETITNPFVVLGLDCKARGCHLDDQFNIEKLRYEIVHWKHGQETDDHHLTLAKPDLVLVQSWLRNIHA